MKRRKEGGRAILPLLLLAAWGPGVTASKSTDAASISSFPSSSSSSRHLFRAAGTPLGRAPVVARTDPETCFRACQMALREPNFADIQLGAGFLDKECFSHLMQTSLFLCWAGFCGSDQESVGLARLNDTCTKYNHAPLPPLDCVLDAYPTDRVARLRRLQRAEAVPDMNLTEVVVLSAQLYENAYDTLDALMYVQKWHFHYGAAMLVFWFVVVLYGTGSRLLATIVCKSSRLHCNQSPTIGSRAAGYQPLEEDDDDDQPVQKASLVDTHRHNMSRRPHIWLQRYLTLPATFGQRCSQDFGWYTVPPRIQTLTLAVFVAMNMVACLTGYRVFAGNMYWPTISQQVYRYVSDRTGIVSFANFPLIWLFGMRNNVLLWLTGWDFGTYNNFHRWVARVATIQAIVHSVGYTILVWQDGGFPEFLAWWSRYFWWTGGVATVCMSLLLGLSLLRIRRTAYEVFLIVHIVLSVLILCGMLAHVSIFNGQYDVFFWACLVSWVADRVLRALRILAFNPRFWTTRARATYDPRANIVRLVIPSASSLYQPQPGTYFYLHVLNNKRFWESHPFTVATVTSPKQNPGRVNSGMGNNKSLAQSRIVELANQSDAWSTTRQDLSEASGLLQPGTDYGSNQSQHLDHSHHQQKRPSSSSHTTASTMTFLIRPYDSFTGRLRDHAVATTATNPASLRVLVDGPYGHDRRFGDDSGFDSVLFVVGGSGIVVPLSHLTGLGRDHTLSSPWSSSQHRRRLRNTRIVWAVREVEFAAAVLREDFGDVLFDEEDDDDITGGSTRVTLDVYVTQSKQRVVEDDDEEEREDGQVFGNPLPRGVRVLYGRPDVRGEVECAAQGSGVHSKLAVVACGPGRMADEARRAVVDVLGRRGAGDIEYLEESFQW